MCLLRILWRRCLLPFPPVWPASTFAFFDEFLDCEGVGGVGGAGAAADAGIPDGAL